MSPSPAELEPSSKLFPVPSTGLRSSVLTRPPLLPAFLKIARSQRESSFSCLCHRCCGMTRSDFEAFCNGTKRFATTHNVVVLCDRLQVSPLEGLLAFIVDHCEDVVRPEDIPALCAQLAFPSTNDPVQVASFFDQVVGQTIWDNPVMVKSLIAYLRASVRSRYPQ